ncbi:NAD(P)-binding protein [Pseudohyphozyma bogoriensis]|nr:NAD(P)-binding protein [Pseudohyphozyma bogoriensis]
MIAVAVAATISVFCVLALVIYSIEFLISHSRLSPIERINAESRASLFLKSNYGLLFFNLLAGDLMQGLGFMINIYWLSRNSYPSTPHEACTVQAVFIELGDVASAFSSLLIGMHVFTVIVIGYKPTRNVCLAFMVLEWAVVIVLASIGPTHLTKNGHPFYGWAGGWCWITPQYQSMRLWLHYFWVFLVAGVNLVAYSAIAVKLVRTGKKAGGSAGGSVTRVMLAYPLLYIASILPLATYRAAAMAGHTWSIHILLACGTIFTLSGFFNSMIYTFTRSLVSSDTVRVISRRGSSDPNHFSVLGTMNANGVRLSQGGVGAEASRVIAKYAALVVLAGRSLDKLQETETVIREETPDASLRLLVVDFASFDSVRAAAAEVNAYVEPIHVLVNNAAVLGTPTSTFMTLPGTFIEFQFGTNHLGPFLFTNLIKPRLIASPCSRIVNVASLGHESCPLLADPSFNGGKDGYVSFKAYAQSKTATMLSAVALAERWKQDGVTAFSLHPGVLKSLGQGAATHIVAAFDPSIADQSGSYLFDCAVHNERAKGYALDKAEAERLWKLSEELLGQKFD